MPFHNDMYYSLEVMVSFLNFLVNKFTFFLLDFSVTALISQVSSNINVEGMMY